jgi:DNA (cytosine-5)-methyltransferase 1
VIEAMPRPESSMDRRRPLAKTKEVVALFAGVGGLELGLKRAGGYRAVLACELMEEAQACLVHNFHLKPGREVLPDVTASDFASKLPARFDLLTAGFPCQDLSQAGRTAGISGARSGLILHVLDLLQARSEPSRPEWLLLENVSFMRHIGKGEGMNIVLRRLTELGYAWAYRQVDSQAFGLPQRRKRIFFVACKFGAGDPRAVLLTDDADRPAAVRGPAWRRGTACGFYWTEGNSGVGWAHNAIPPLKGGSTVQIPSPPAIVHPREGLVLPTIEDTEALQGFDRGWTKPAIGQGRDRDGRMRWYLIGNAVSVPVSQWIGHRLRAPVEYPEERIVSARPIDGPPWPAAAWRISPNEGPMASQESDWPLSQETRTEVGLATRSLLDLLDDGSSTRVPLSRRATVGFLKRFRKSRLLLRSDPDLRSALIEELETHRDRSQ